MRCACKLIRRRAVSRVYDSPDIAIARLPSLRQKAPAIGYGSSAMDYGPSTIDLKRHPDTEIELHKVVGIAAVVVLVGLFKRATVK
jgi:hypothetical protein